MYTEAATFASQSLTAPLPEKKMIRFNCPNCGKALQVKEEHTGYRVACPGCQHPLVVPGGNGAGQPGVPAAPPSAPQRPRPNPEEPEESGEGGPSGPGRQQTKEVPPGKAETSTSGKAIASLILGLLSMCCPCSPLLAFIGLPLGFMAFGDVKRGKGKVKGNGLAIAGVILCSLGGVLWLTAIGITAYVIRGQTRTAEVPKNSKQSGQRHIAEESLKQIASALRKYQEKHGRLPPADLGNDPDRRAGSLSWRVAILPFLGHQKLHDQFNRDQDWDTAHNKPLIAQMPTVFASPGQPDNAGETFFQVLVGPGTMFEPRRSLQTTSAIDGEETTLLVVEGKNPDAWTRPADIGVERAGPAIRVGNAPLSSRALGGHFGDGFLAAMVNGKVQFIQHKNITDMQLRALITRNGRDQAPPLP